VIGRVGSRWISSALLLLPLSGCVHTSVSRPNCAGLGEQRVSASARETVEEDWPDGSPRLRKQVRRLPDGNAVDHGEYTRWYPNGQVEYECFFAEGKKHGVTTMWHRNGQVWTKDHHVHGVRHGVFCTWDDTGQLRKEEQYCDGLPCGTWTVWGAGGEVKIRVEKGGGGGSSSLRQNPGPARHQASPAAVGAMLLVDATPLPDPGWDAIRAASRTSACL